jgi:transposase InsO family protein
MEEQWVADRAKLREYMRTKPEYSIRQLGEELGHSSTWVSKWKGRLKGTDSEDEGVLRSRSRRRLVLPAGVSKRVEDAILDIRDNPPEKLHRVPGPRTILYYLQHDEALRANGEPIPTSSSTIWKVLTKYGRIAGRVAYDHEALQRPAPMQEWEVDFTDVPTVQAQQDGKQQHVVESLNIIDRGTSIVVDIVPDAQYNAESTLVTLISVFMQHGLPQRLRIDRDPRFVGSWGADGYPSALLRFLSSVGVAVDICPPKRPDLKPFVERFNKTLEYECIRPENPTTFEESVPVLKHFLGFYNEERPHQSPTCGNQPPRVAFPNLPQLPRLPAYVDPDAWLLNYHNTFLTRRIWVRGTVHVDTHSYYISRHLHGRTVLLKVDAHAKHFHVQLNGQLIKTKPIKGLIGEELPFDLYIDLICQQARSEHRRFLLKQAAKRARATNR